MPVLLDTSVWIDHLRSGDALVTELLETGEVLGLLGALPRAPIATAEELLVFINRHRLAGRGIGYVDAHLLASAFLHPGLRLLTRDRRLHEAASALHVASSRN